MAEDDLTEFLEQVGKNVNNKGSISKLKESQSCGEDQEEPALRIKTGKNKRKIGDICQWAELGNNSFASVNSTVDELPPGIYRASWSNQQVIITQLNIVSDELLKLPDSTNSKIINSITTFWNAKSKFVKRNQLFKRGMLLWGPPGSGKTVTVMLLTKELVENGGIVLNCNDPHPTLKALEEIRKIEPDRPIICILEDIDEIINQCGESTILSLLDGESQINNVVYLATTNYPDRLDQRIINRPSRFDEVIKIGMPPRHVRSFYLRSRITKEELNDEDLERWLDDTNDLSIAHLKELVIAIFCLGRTYEETIERLKKMKTVSNFNESKLGFV